ncbi:hypothetical protein CJF30_00007543 [Rutstroemia sp. NJR-2017a BBW]|nr:hypothetical protein CJF30_00007543 [Rutstroemia sp. NJR-2017a BBW]
MVGWLDGWGFNGEKKRITNPATRWRSTSPRNEWKDEPWGIEKLPTVVKVTKELIPFAFPLFCKARKWICVVAVVAGADDIVGLGEIG